MSLCVPLYAQCGGAQYTGPTCCDTGLVCQVQSQWYSQCIPQTGIPPAEPTKVPQPPTQPPTQPETPVSGIATGRTTRYWDCCKPSCSWPGKGRVTAPVNTCSRDGISLVSPDARSGCDGGPAFACTNHQPWAVSSTLSYGYVAANIKGQTEMDFCCSCYKLEFMTKPLIGKSMIVQVTNTGADLTDDHFDIQLPGGGVGLFNGCAPQWNAPENGWGERYGGIKTAAECNQLPEQLQSGCLWRFGWFMNADNPDVRYTRVDCPKDLVQRTGCVRV